MGTEGLRPNRRGLDVEAVMAGVRPVPLGTSPPTTLTAPVTGTTPEGTPRRVEVHGPSAARWTVLLFLSPSCQGCSELWSLVREGRAGDVSVVAVTQPLSRREARQVARLTGDGTTVVSAEAWAAYRVLGAPLLTLVSAVRDAVVLESVAWGRQQVETQVAEAVRQDGDLTPPQHHAVGLPTTGTRPPGPAR